LASRRFKIRFAQSFFIDLDDIFEYISGNFSQELASDIINEIHREITEKLSNNSNMGRVYPDDIFYHYMFVSKRKDIVFYHIEDSDTLVVYRIFDQRRNYGRLLKGK
jgi:plasmid stabilization system protein ParE